jgi:hypothetical protein
MSQDTPLTEEELGILSFVTRIETRTRPHREIIDVDMEPTTRAPAKASKRGGERLKHCRAAIVGWRTKCWKDNYAGSAWGPGALMSDSIITKLATRRHITTINTLKQEIPEWDFVEWHGMDVLATIMAADGEWERMKENTPPTRSEKPLKTSGSATTSRAALQPLPIPQLLSMLTSAVPTPALPPSQAFVFPAPLFAYPPPAPQTFAYPPPAPQTFAYSPAAPSTFAYPPSAPYQQLPSLLPGPMGAPVYPPGYFYYSPVGPVPYFPVYAPH